MPSIVSRRSIRFAKRTRPAGRGGPGDGECNDDLRIVVAALLGMPTLAQRIERQPAPLVAGDIRLVGLEPGGGGVVEHQIDVQLEEIHATPKDLLLDGIAVLGQQVERPIKLAQGQILRLG